jgi:hypothetical protein
LTKCLYYRFHFVLFVGRVGYGAETAVILHLSGIVFTARRFRIEVQPMIFDPVMARKCAFWVFEE